MHDEIQQFVQLRLLAWETILDGLNTGDESQYDIAEGLLRQARDRIPDLNVQLTEIDIALTEAAGKAALWREQVIE